MKPHPSFLNLLTKGVKLAAVNIWRNKFLSIATIFVIGIIIFIFNIILAVNFIAQDALTDLSRKIDITVYLKESSTLQDALNIIADVAQLEGVENAVYVSKDDALNQIQVTHPDLSLAFERYNLGNPLPASINITTTHPDYHEEIAEFLQQNKYQTYLSSIVAGTDSTNNSIITSVSQNLQKVTNFAQQIIFWIVITFVIGGTLVILNALQITIFHRKKEITVMKMVGAPHWFIRLPFVIESVIYAILATVLSFIMLLILSQKIQIQETAGIKFHVIFLIELIATVILGATSSIFAVHEYLQKKFLE